MSRVAGSPSPRRGLGPIGSIALLGVTVIACAAPAPTPTSTPTSTTRPSLGTGASSVPSATAPSPTESSGPPALDSCQQPSTDPEGSIEIDASLLDVLPPAVAEVARRPCPAAAFEIAASSELSDDIGAIAVGLYGSDDDVAVAIVSRPREGGIDAEWFRGWRDSFDAGVCEQAGGVDAGHSEFDAGSVRIHRSTCAGGVTMYHAWLPVDGVIVSVQAVGPLDLGRQIVTGLSE